MVQTPTPTFSRPQQGLGLFCSGTLRDFAGKGAADWLRQCLPLFCLQLGSPSAQLKLLGFGTSVCGQREKDELWQHEPWVRPLVAGGGWSGDTLPNPIRSLSSCFCLSGLLGGLRKNKSPDGSDYGLFKSSMLFGTATSHMLLGSLKVSKPSSVICPQYPACRDTSITRQQNVAACRASCSGF